MDFHLSEEELELKQMAREFAEKRLYPRAMEFDEEGTTPAELIKECAELGYFGFTVPEEYGGLGLSASSFMGVLEELCAACAGFGIMLSVHNSLTCEILKLFGSEELKQKYLPAMATGEKIGAYCITEPNAGTDVASLSTTAVDKGDHYLLNGTKTFVTNAGFAGVLIVFAKTDPDAGHRGISCFIVDQDSEGIMLGAPERKCGIKASDTREISFSDVKVPKENLCGEIGKGFRQAVTILNSGRIGVSFQAIGIAQAALNEALKYSKERKQFGQPIGSFQSLQHYCADMRIMLDGLRTASYYAAWQIGEECDADRSIAVACAYAHRVVPTIVGLAHQIHGAIGNPLDCVMI